MESQGNGQLVLPVLVNTFFEKRVNQLFDLAERIEAAFSSAGIEYRVVGGLAVYLYVEAAEPDAGRLTKDVDITVRREDLHRIAAAVAHEGFELRHVAGVDMLVQTAAPSARRGVHLVFAGEKVRPEYVEPAPGLGPCTRLRGIPLIPLPDLVRMKLTSFRARDEAHLKDLDEAGLITPETESGLAPVLRDRLAQLRARH
jgi:hypothetical protein